MRKKEKERERDELEYYFPPVQVARAFFGRVVGIRGEAVT